MGVYMHCIILIQVNDLHMQMQIANFSEHTPPINYADLFVIAIIWWQLQLTYSPNVFTHYPPINNETPIGVCIMMGCIKSKL
jgi:hypothetical protein